MTIQSQTTRVDYTGNGATTNFPVPFYWLQDTDLLVIRTDSAYTPPTVATLALTTDYVVTGSGNQSGGSITTTVAPTATQKLSILRNVPFTQLTHYVPNDPFPAASHEQALDKLTMETQQLNEGLSRSITLPPNATGLSTNLPLPAANNLIGWNPAANALQNVDPTTIATAVTYGNAVADKFSGDGTTVNFNLSANPGGINNLDVSISGVTQRPGIDYTWTTGTTLTFTTAPPSGTNNVLARYTQALPVGLLGVGQVTATNLAAGAVADVAVASGAAIQSSKLSYLAPFTGAVARAVQARLAERISVKDFGAVGDGVTDDTAAVQACMTWCYNNFKRMFVPTGTYKLTSKVSVPGPMTIIGEAISPPVTPALQQGQPVVTFRSTVTTGYAMQCGSTTYARGGHYENFRIYGAGTAQHGLYLQNQGWDGCIRNVTIEGFTGTGVTLDYLQDSTITNLSIIDCGAENQYPALNIINGSNILRFEHLRLEITPYMMNVNAGADLYFSGCHFETSEYVSGAITALNRYTRYSTIIINNASTDIQFDSCIFGPNSVQGVAGHFSVSPTSVAAMVSVAGCANVRFSKCRFAMSGNRSANYLSFNSGTSSTSVTECSFEQVYTDVNAIVLSGTTFVNNDVSWFDDGVSTLMYGLANQPGGSPSIVENNRLYQNISTGQTKTAGYLFTSQTGGSYLTIGYNQNSVSKYYKHHNAASVAKSWMQASNVNLTGFSGTIDFEFYDINAQFYWTGTATITSMANMCSGQRVKLYNSSVGTLTVTNAGGNVVLKGNVNASVPSNGVLTLEENANGYLIEVSRNF